MAITVVGRGASTNPGFAGEDITMVPSSNCTGKMGVFCIAYDNAGTNGADPYVSISDSNSNTWTARVNVLRDPGSISDGIVVRIFTTAFNGGLLTTSDQITVDVNNTMGAFATSLYDVNGDSLSYVTGATTSGASTSGTITSSSIPDTDLIIGVTGIEQDDAITADSDTTNGSWANTQTAADTFTGINTNAISISTQTKIVNADGAQTYNTSWATSCDYGLAWIQIHDTPSASSIDPFGTLGIFGI